MPALKRLALVTALASLVAASQASAATTLGESYSGSGGISCTYGGTHIQTVSPGPEYAAPYDGVITSWGNRGYFWDTVTFKVARLGSGGSYTVIGSDGPQTKTFDGQLATYPTRIPVRQGDVIGARIPNDNYTCPYSDGGGYTYGVDDADVAVGGTGSFDTTTGYKAPIQATIERDRDGDGYGDETQDQCPTSASTHGVCPLPTTLGQTFTPTTIGCLATHIPTGPADLRFAAGSDGVITAWSYQANALVDGTVKFKAFRPLGGNDYRALGESEARTPAANVLNTFATRIPVLQGDRIGLRAESVPCLANSGSGAGLATAGDVAPGASATFDVTQKATDVSAVLEADADNDGYGDTSQDLCPTDPSTQGQCPAVQPPDDGKCDAAREKLAKAKAKLKKLKKKDAAAKKLKAAKQKVKKAKSAVKEEC